MGLRHWERRLATGANAVLVAAFVVVAIHLAIDAAGRVAPRWDLSADHSATLRPETVDVLRRLEARGEPVRITAFSVQQKDELAATRDRLLRDFLRELEAASPDLTTDFVDLDRDRLTAERLGVDRYGAVVIERAGDRVDLQDREIFRRSGPKDAREVTFVGEGAVVAGFERLLLAGTRVIYALDGHGELLPYDRGLGDLRGLADVLATLGFRTRTLDLLNAAGPPEVPGDAAAVLILAPKARLTPPEEDALRAYLERGGGVGIWLEPTGAVPELLEGFGVIRPTGVVIDPRSMYPWEDRPFLAPRRHPVTEGLAGDGLAVVAGHAAPLELQPVDGVTGGPLLGTSPAGWVERGHERPATFDPDHDTQGPVEVAAALVRGRGRLVVVGDVDLVGDPLIDEGPGNRAFTAAAVRHLAADPSTATVIGAPRAVRRVLIDARRLLQVRIALVGIWPLMVLAVGGWLFATRGRG